MKEKADFSIVVEVHVYLIPNLDNLLNLDVCIRPHLDSLLILTFSLLFGAHLEGKYDIVKNRACKQKCLEFVIVNKDDQIMRKHILKHI